jgi:hypothetical protein
MAPIYSNIDVAERNADALMLIDGVTLKRKFKLSWKYLSITDAKNMMLDITNVANRIVPISYYEILTDTVVSGNFYTGDKEFNITKLVAGKAPYIMDFSFNIIEQ